MDDTRRVDQLSNAVDTAFAPVIYSPEIVDYACLEPYRKEIEKLVDDIAKKYQIPVSRQLPITAYIMSHTIFRIYKICDWINRMLPFDRAHGTSFRLFLKYGKKPDLIIQNAFTYKENDYCEKIIYDHYSMKDQIIPRKLSRGMKSNPVTGSDIIPIHSIMTRVNPNYILMLYGNEYVEVGEVKMDHKNVLSITEVRPLRLKEAKGFANMFRKLETLDLGIIPDPKAFQDVIYFRELPSFEVVWYNRMKAAKVHVNDTKFTHPAHPELIFHYKEGDVSTFVFKGGMLYHAAFMNVDDRGKICMGRNTKIKAGMLSELMTQVEEWFFYTRFTHSNSQKYTPDDRLNFIKGNYDLVELKPYKSLNEYLSVKGTSLNVNDDEDDD